MAESVPECLQVALDVREARFREDESFQMLQKELSINAKALSEAQCKLSEVNQTITRERELYTDMILRNVTMKRNDMDLDAQVNLMLRKYLYAINCCFILTDLFRCRRDDSG